MERMVCPSQRPNLLSCLHLASFVMPVFIRYQVALSFGTEKSVVGGGSRENGSVGRTATSTDKCLLMLYRVVGNRDKLEEVIFPLSFTNCGSLGSLSPVNYGSKVV